MRAPQAPAFSLLEVIVVLVIIGVIGAIAIPRMSSAAGNSQGTALAASTSQVQRAIDLYSAEHLERNPAIDPDGTVNTDAHTFVNRLVGTTSDAGALDPAGIYGPYLRAWPTNPANKLASVRIGGAAAGANTHGWRFDPVTAAFQADNLGTGSISIGVGGGAVADTDP